MPSLFPLFGTLIAAVILIGVNIYIVLNDRDNIQKWLIRCLWRRMPMNVNFSAEKQERYKKLELIELPIWPDMKMEMNELKLALGEGG